VDYLDYHIIKFKGLFGSFEREYYDLIRGGFLKYIMQMKIGQMQGAAIAYHNTQKIFGFEYIKLEEMEKRIFGCREFSDVVFETAVSLLEEILDHVLADRVGQLKAGEAPKTYRIGLYAYENTGLTVMFERFENDDIYLDRFRNYYNPDELKDIIDTYLTHQVVPNVTQYNVNIVPFINGVHLDSTPILYEPGDFFEVKYSIQRVGSVDFNTYMRYLHESYKSPMLNINNVFSGGWSFNI
jgi:hypothetical protein